MHYIRYDVLYAYVLSRLQYWSVLVQQDGDKLLKRLLNASDKERNTARKRQTAELKKAEKRKAEVDTLFAKMYEDWSAGRITEYNFNMLSEKYQGEQRELDAKIERLHEAMEAATQTAVDAEKWIGLMKQYVNPTELTAELLNTLIEKILVHEAAYWTPAQNFAKAIVNGEVTADNAEAKTLDFYNQINTSIVK